MIRPNSTQRKDINSFLLTENITVGEARKWIKEKDDEAKRNLIKLINHRFNNRYVKHLYNIDSGFLKMAISCLMIETLESFRQGRENTNGRGVGLKIFKDFFKTEHNLFPGFRDIASDFYSSIRCGILHQAETTNSWRILRKDALLDKTNRTINATKFVEALDNALRNYTESLKTSEFNSPIWINALLKIENVCANCEVK